MAQNPEPHFDLFVSYSRKDSVAVSRLIRALTRYRIPKALAAGKPRRLRVFCDVSDAGTGNYHERIAQYLNDSRKLLVVCSPHSAASQYVGDEIRSFARTRLAEDIIPIIISGKPNNEIGPQEEPRAAFHPALCSVLGMPLAADFSALAAGSFRREPLRSAWHMLLADLLGVRREVIDERERIRKQKLLVTVSAVSLAIAGVFGYLAYLAARQSEISDSRALAFESINQLDQDPVRAMQLALESYQQADTELGREALLRSFDSLHLARRIALPNSTPLAWQKSSSGQVLMARRPTEVLLVTDAKHAMKLRVLAHDAPKEGMKDTLLHAELSHDGSYVVSSSTDMTTRLWSTATAGEIENFKFRDGLTSAAAFSPDSRLLALAPLDANANANANANEVVIVELQSGVVQQRWPVPGAVYHLAFSSESRHLTAIGDWSKPMRLELATKQTSSLDVTKRSASIESITQSDSSGRTAVSCDAFEGCVAQVYDRNGRALLAEPDFGHNNRLKLRANEQYAITFSLRPHADLWDLEESKKVGQLRGHLLSIYDADFSPNENLVATAGLDGTARVWRLRDLQQVAVMTGHRNPVDHVMFLDDESLVTEDRNEALMRWQVSANLAHTFKESPNPIPGLAWNHDGSRFFTAGEDGRVLAFDARTGTMTVIENLPSRIRSLDFCAGSRLGAFGTYSGQLAIWSDGPSKVVRKLTLPGEDEALHGTIYRVMFSRDCKKVLAVGEEYMAAIWSTETFAHERTFQVDEPNNSFFAGAISPNGQLIAAGGDGDSVYLWDTRTGEQRWSITDFDRAVQSIAFSPDGRTLAVGGSNDGRIVDVETGKTLIPLPGLVGEAFDVSFNADGSQLATANNDATAKIWDTRTGALTCILRGHQLGLNSVRYSPDQKYVVTASADGTAAVWYVPTCRQVQTLTGHTQFVRRAAFSPDGTRIVTTSNDGNVRIWDTYVAYSREQLLQLAKQRLSDISH